MFTALFLPPLLGWIIYNLVNDLQNHRPLEVARKYGRFLLDHKFRASALLFLILRTIVLSLVCQVTPGAVVFLVLDWFVWLFSVTGAVGLSKNWAWAKQVDLAKKRRFAFYCAMSCASSLGGFLSAAQTIIDSKSSCNIASLVIAAAEAGVTIWAMWELETPSIDNLGQFPLVSRPRHDHTNENPAS